MCKELKKAVIKVYLIRHGMTEGNLKKRYIGTTDESLCRVGREKITENCRHAMYPQAERVYVSPKKRCMETAKLIYPGAAFQVVADLSECDFGLFENKNYQELSDCPEYQAWIDSNGTLPFPDGESRKDFQKRSVEAFEKCIKECAKDGITRVAFVVHGGTIMGIMEKYASPSGDYYDYQIENGEGYELTMANDASGGSRICTGSSAGGSEMAVPSGAADRGIDIRDGKNYQRLTSKK